MRATRAIIYTDHFRHNLRQVRALAGPDREICAAVKANAYGHGAVELSRIALAEGVRRLAVATVEEAAELREAGISARIVLLSLATPDEVSDIVSLELEPVVAREDFVALLGAEAARQSRRIAVHLKIDTGMGRIGVRAEEAPALAAAVVGQSALEIAGMATHFPVADTEDSEFTREQVRALDGAVREIRAAGIDPGVIHAANSGATLRYPGAHLDMLRPGIMLYGYYPSHDQLREVELKPVMELRSQLVFMKRVAAGTTVSYGRSWTAPRETVIGTVPAGYADGYNRLLSNRAVVSVRGRACPVVGRVCMDQFMVDLGPNPGAELYDDVVLFGPTPPAPTAEDIADMVDSIPYEVTCRVDARVPRLYRRSL